VILAETASISEQVVAAKAAQAGAGPTAAAGAEAAMASRLRRVGTMSVVSIIEFYVSVAVLIGVALSVYQSPIRSEAALLFA
jgi:hypothetical protein